MKLSDEINKKIKPIEYRTENIQFRLTPKLAEKFKNKCQRHDVTMTEVLIKLVEMYTEE